MRLQLLSMLTVQADALGAGTWLRDRLTEYTTMNGEVPRRALRVLLECALPAAVARMAARERQQAQSDAEMQLNVCLHYTRV